MSRDEPPGTDQPPSSAMLTPKQAAVFLQVSTRTIFRWIDTGELVAHRLGRQLRISRADFETFVKARRGS